MNLAADSGAPVQVHAVCIIFADERSVEFWADDVVWLLDPAIPWPYGAAYLGYALANGFRSCVFAALALDMVGARKHAASTAYAVLHSSGNLAIS
jgi:hypothetical protein